MQCVETTLGYNYEVPKNWDSQRTPRSRSSEFAGISLSGITTYGDYTCEGKSFTKGTNGGTLLPKGDINHVGHRLHQGRGRRSSTRRAATRKVTLTQPKPVKIQHTQKDGKKVVVDGVQVDATVTQTANKCLAGKGMVKVVVLNGSNKLHVLVDQRRPGGWRRWRPTRRCPRSPTCRRWSTR